MPVHRVTGSAVREGKDSRGRKRQEITWTCSCGGTVTGSGWKLANAERKISAAWRRHKRTAG